MHASIFFTILSIVMQSYTYATKCNGFEELCDLNIMQVTLAGTHNSGAGFDSHLNYHSFLGKIKAVSCWYRNQDKSFYGQLDLGIRYFDIDSCLEDYYDPKGAWICHADAYAGSIKKMISQIDRWMNEDGHEEEVIVIHFNRDFASEDSDKTAKDIIRQLEGTWIHSDSSKVAIQPSKYAKLGSAVNQNKRIYIIMHNDLLKHNHKNWAIPHWKVGYTWTSMTFINSNGCHNLVKSMGKDRCTREASRNFVRYDLYLSSGLCTWDMASHCNQHIQEGLNRCFSGTKTKHKTVNFIVVDYADKRVIEGARKQNIKNIKMYLGKDVTK
ncbi:uncharacterized protein LOC130655570 [Hydractinia symbiolongicarpus]|uniref:uncharacterized protein LOC130655570 n=1 Tax=Hydractinia symbiolongicarpus TaxID=13093 RepID=UPI00254E8E97|nr:uncharacterized protein LOC130655570 [Hydractinia symbiolongicarpus]